MARYLITYDLIKQKDYKRIIDELTRIGAVKVLLSTWIYENNNNTSMEIAKHLLKYLDADDRILVVPVTTPAAWRGIDNAKAAFPG